MEKTAGIDSCYISFKFCCLSNDVCDICVCLCVCVRANEAKEAEVKPTHWVAVMRENGMLEVTNNNNSYTKSHFHPVLCTGSKL